MYRSKLVLVLVAMMLLALAVTVQAQELLPTSTPVDPNANISWPPPVYVLRGEFTVRGAANLPNMVSYFLEFRPLNPDLMAGFYIALLDGITFSLTQQDHLPRAALTREAVRLMLHGISAGTDMDDVAPAASSDRAPAR